MRDCNRSQGDPESVIWGDLFQLHEALHAFLHPLERKQTKDPNSGAGVGATSHFSELRVCAKHESQHSHRLHGNCCYALALTGSVV